MEEKILSTEELISQINRPNYTLPTFGDKITVSNGKKQQQESNDLDQRIQGLKFALETPRVMQRSQLSEAVWDIVKGQAKVTKALRKHWEVMGHIRDNQLHLHPEEEIGNHILLKCCNPSCWMIGNW